MKINNRRDFLKSAGLLAASAPVLAAFFEASNPTGEVRVQPLSRRRLLFDSEEIPRIRANLETPRLSQIRAMLRDIDVSSESRWLREELRLTNHVTDFNRARQLVQNTAFAHVVWEDPAHLELALLALARLCDYKRWDYFLEGGQHTIGLQRAPEATIASCYALDWLGDKVPLELRTRVEHKIANEGAPACYRTLYGMKHPDRVRGWGFDPEDDYQLRFDLSRWPLILNGTNLKIIPTCGLGLAAVWFHGRHPNAEKWLNLSRQSARAFSTMYGEDGSFDEGASYWGYTTSHLAMVVEAVNRCLGIDDRKLINFPGTVRYALALAMSRAGAPLAEPKPSTSQSGFHKPSYESIADVINFCDAGSGLDVTVAAWVGQMSEDPIANHVAQHIGSLSLLQAAVWLRPEAPQSPPGPELHDVRLSNDWVISRTGWDPWDTVLALRSGGPSNHEHADRNSLIFKSYGERLFHDPFGAGFSPTLARWLLRQTEAHSAVLINGQGHQYHDGREGTNASWATASVSDYRTSPGWMTVTSDATEAYALVLPDIVLVTRTLIFLKPDVLLLVDCVELTTPASVQARFQVFNDDGDGSVVSEGQGFTIKRPNATLAAVVHGMGDMMVATGFLALPAIEGVFPYAEITSVPARSHTILTVCTAAPLDGAHRMVAIKRLDAGWFIECSHGRSPVGVTITTVAESAPRIAISG